MVVAPSAAMPLPHRRPALRAALAAALLAPATLACEGSDAPAADTSATGAPYPPPPAPAGASSGLADSVPLETILFWDAPAAQSALMRASLQPRVIRSPLAYAGLINGLALGVGDAEIHLFFYGDIGAADRAYRQLDARLARPVGGVASGPPRALINNNMLILIFGGDDTLRERVWRALTPGNEDQASEEVEP